MDSLKVAESNDSSSKKKKMRWEKSETIGNMRKSISVEEVENGFVIRKSQYGSEESDGKYTDINETYISKTNPLEKEKPKEEKTQEESIIDGLENLNM